MSLSAQLLEYKEVDYGKKSTGNVITAEKRRFAGDIATF
jgi:hypothetical protein